MPYRVKQNGETVLDLRDREPFRLGGWHAPNNHLQRGGPLPDGYTVEHYEPEPPAPYVPKPEDIELYPAQFFMAVDTMAGLTPADPPPDVWLQEQIEASTVLSPQQKRQAVIYVRKAPMFKRSNEFMDVLGGAILGQTPEQLDQAFLNVWQQEQAAA